MTVADLEQFFEREFELHIQVFRKVGNTWQETTLSDQLTLGEQNSIILDEASIQGKPPLDHHNARTEWFLG
jgi:hypothetical protein